MTDQMFSTRTAPWMKLGELVDRPQTAAEAAQLAKMNFTVSLSDVFIGEDKRQVKGQKAVTADDNGQFFGFVSGERYHVLQYEEAFGFMDQINPTYIAAGHLRNRSQGFMVVETAMEMNVLGGEDPHNLYAVLRTSHDCSRAVEISIMPLRGRCMNQLTLKSFAKNVQQKWSIKHLKSMKERLSAATDTIAKMDVYATRFATMVEKMAQTQISVDAGRKILETVIKQPTGKTERVERQYTERLDQIIALWNDSPTVGYPSTGWGLVNAVSEQYDWHRQAGTPESRFLGALQGSTHNAINDVAARVLSHG